MLNTWRHHVTGPLVLASLYASLLYAPSRAEAPAVNACALVTTTEVEQIIGRLKMPPRLIRAERALTCEYAFVNAQEALVLWVFSGDALERAKHFAKDARVPVAGFGAEAFLYRDVVLGSLELWLKKEDRVLQVILKAAPGEEEKIKAIAKKALSRL